RMILVVPAPDPEAKRRVFQFDDITPIFRERRCRVQATRGEFRLQILHQGSAPTARVDLLLFTRTPRKGTGTKLNMELVCCHTALYTFSPFKSVACALAHVAGATGVA